MMKTTRSRNSNSKKNNLNVQPKISKNKVDNPQAAKRRKTNLSPNSTDIANPIILEESGNILLIKLLLVFSFWQYRFIFYIVTHYTFIKIII